MNVEFTSLTINGYGDQPVPNQFLRQLDETKTLAVLLPGLGYTADMPLFYYAERIVLDRGWDAIRVDYDYPALAYSDRLEIRQQQLEERKQQLHADVDATLAEGLRQRDYDTIVLIGKSLGTRAMAHVLSEGITYDLWNVWLTPVINVAEVREHIERYPGKTFVVIGTDDFAWDEHYLDRLEVSGDAEVILVDGADHSLDISGDIEGSIQAVGQVMSRLDEFLPE